MRFNINHSVRVKLTDEGRKKHRQNHVERFSFLNKKTADLPKYRPPEEDDDGWSEWQLWHLMQEFGPHIWNGCKVPFETEIEILETKQ